MLLENQTITDYTFLVTQNKLKYLTLQTESNIKFATHQEEHGSTLYTMIANSIDATKIIFDRKAGLIVIQTMYKTDFYTYQELQKKINE